MSVSKQFKVSTPSRICLFGEHQDYLGLEVIASAINLRFSAKVTPREDDIIRIDIRDESIDQLGQKNLEGKYQRYEIDLSKPLVYENSRDYFKSIINVLRREGFQLKGADVVMDSEIPIGKGMCSSTTMCLALTKALAYYADPEKSADPEYMALLAWKAEVEEFNEPGGMMDHYTSALGGLVHLNFSDPKNTTVERLDVQLDGCFILFDSKQQKDTIKVLGNSKYPTQEAIQQLNGDGITSIRDFYNRPELVAATGKLDDFHRRKVEANINNYRIQREALAMFQSGKIDDEKVGRLLNEHQANLRDGLGISTPVIDHILELAMANGAYGGKFNGSGGGGCLYVYAAKDKADAIMEAARKEGYPCMMLTQDVGLKVEE